MKTFSHLLIKWPYCLPAFLFVIGGLVTFISFKYQELSVVLLTLDIFIILFVLVTLVTFHLLKREAWKNSDLIETLNLKNKQLTENLASQIKELDANQRAFDDALQSLKELQQQLISQEKMASIGALTAGIAHEIKNPLNFINNFSDMTIEMLVELKAELTKLSADSAQTATIDEIIEDITSNCKKINEHGKRAESIIKNMLIQSRNVDSEKMLTNINALLEEYLNLAYHGMRAQNNKFNAKLEKHLDTSITEIMISPQNMGRVFLNLINNGLYAANEKKLQANFKEQFPDFIPTITISSAQNDHETIIKIKDNGNGIPEAIRKKIFEPFFTTKPTGQGTGLGLPICYEIIVQEHGGKLEVTTMPGEYTEFSIILPKEQLIHLK